MPGDPTLRQEELLRPGGVDAFDNSLPVPEAFPYFDGYFIYPAPYFLYNEWWYPPPELVIIIDFSPWTVYGSHHEKTTDTAPYKYSTNSANGCNWGDTFNPM